MLATGQHEREQLTESLIETLPSEEARGETGWESDAGLDWVRESEEKEKEREGRDMREKINAMSTRDIMSWHFFYRVV